MKGLILTILLCVIAGIIWALLLPEPYSLIMSVITGGFIGIKCADLN